MDEPRIIIDGDDIIFPEDEQECLQAIQTFLDALMQRREKYPMITDEDMAEMEASKDKFVDSLAKCKETQEAADNAQKAADEARARYETALQQHQTRQAQAGIGKALRSKRKFQD